MVMAVAALMVLGFGRLVMVVVLGLVMSLVNQLAHHRRLALRRIVAVRKLVVHSNLRLMLPHALFPVDPFSHSLWADLRMPKMQDLVGQGLVCPVKRIHRTHRSMVFATPTAIACKVGFALTPCQPCFIFGCGAPNDPFKHYGSVLTLA